MPLTLVFMMGRALWTPAAMGTDAFAHLPGKGMTAVWVRGTVTSGGLQGKGTLSRAVNAFFLQNVGE